MLMSVDLIWFGLVWGAESSASLLTSETLQEEIVRDIHSSMAPGLRGSRGCFSVSVPLVC